MRLKSAKMALSAADPSGLEASLTQHVFLTCDTPSSLDGKIFEELGAQVLSSTTYPYLYSWYALMSQFTTQIRKSWPDPPKPSEPYADYDFDLLSDDPETEEEAKKLASSKKSTVIFDVKPASSSVNLDEIALKIMILIMHEGLAWGNDYKKVPIAYGIFKLQIGCVITDDISIDDLIDEMVTIKGTIKQDNGDEAEDCLFQSVDILSVSKV